MAQAQVVTEAQDLLMGLGDTTFLNSAYTQIVAEFSKATGGFIATAIVEQVTGTAAYSISSVAADAARCIMLLAVHCFPSEIERETLEALADWDAAWQSTNAPAATNPTHWTSDVRDTTKFLAYPIPIQNGTAGGQATFQGVGSTVPTNDFVTIVQQTPLDADIPTWLEGILSYRLAAREARRLGETTDLLLADALDGLSQLIETAIVAQLIAG